MRISDFELYRDIMQDRTGRLLDAHHSYVVESRLAPVAKKWGYPSVAAMTPGLRGLPDEEIMLDIVEAMTDSDTSFFRDQKPFTLFQAKLIPYLIKARRSKKTIRIWSAATSTGQEAYSIAIALKEIADSLPGYRISLMASDVSEMALDKARTGLYSQFEMQQGMPIKTLLEYFEKKDNSWQAKPDLQRMITFHTFNLLDDMQPLGTFDVIFCRNVLSLMDPEIARDILDRISHVLQPDGFLILGQNENPGSSFKPLDEEGCLYCRDDSIHS